ncbi:hypothetical protein DRP05_00875 [Archaeoglobales archaeon]|nr:MAG: hypothetical protein DRP05_00875 [Archaeoglobales archaeon]
MLDKNDSNKHSNSKNSSKSFSIEMLLDEFSYWFPKARDYGYAADELYVTDENAVAIAIPIPLLEDGNYRLWLFHFCRVERITPRGVEILIAELSRMFDEKLGHLIHFRHYYIIADRVTRRIPPRCSRAKSVYVIKVEYAYKIYEIIAKAIAGFVRSFRKNVKYGDDLLVLCYELETFAEKLRKRADEIKSTTCNTHHPSDTRNKQISTKEEAEEYLALLERAEVVK